MKRFEQVRMSDTHVVAFSLDAVERVQWKGGIMEIGLANGDSINLSLPDLEVEATRIWLLLVGEQPPSHHGETGDG